MGRGLSDLQKTVLRVALANRDRERRDLDDLGFEPPAGHRPAPCDVFRVEVLSAHFGWPLYGVYHEREGRHWRQWSGQHFNIADIGVCRYRSAQASLTRAMVRLQGRGLATLLQGVSKWAGANLTPEGIRVAKELSVKEVTRCDFVNR